MTLAVTGHRDIIIDEQLIERIDLFFRQMLEKHKALTLLSALADGADQVAAKCALKYENISLEVPLPMSQEAYVETVVNKNNFLNLLDKSDLSYVIEKVSEDPYENLGHYLVDNADILLALWDGSYNARQGGTSEVVAYAKSKDHTIIHLPVQRQHN